MLPPENDAATMSGQRYIAMPSPVWSRRSRRRALVALDQDQRSVEGTLGQTVHKKTVVPLGFCSTRSLPMVPLGFCFATRDVAVSLGRLKKSSDVFLGVYRPHPSAKMRPGGGPHPADEPGKAERQEERRPTSSSAKGSFPSKNFELSRDEAKAKVRETIAMDA